MPTVSTTSDELIDGLRVIVLREPSTGSEAHVAPELASNVVRFRTRIGERTVDVLDAAPDTETLRAQPGRYGAPPLFPYPGRVRGGRFSFRGRDVTLPKNFEGNAIHGFLRGRFLDLVSMDKDSVTTRFDSRSAGISAEEWPFPCRLTLTISLRAGILRVDCEVVNTGDGPMPMGLGFHHYFPGSNDHAVWVEADEQWAQTPQGLPTGRIDQLGPSDGLRVPRFLRDFPTEFISPRGEVRNLLFRRSDGGASAGVRYPEHGCEARLDSSPEFGALVLYTPPGTPAISLEPHSCVPDAFNLVHRGLPTGMVELDPGDVWRAWWEVRAIAI